MTLAIDRGVACEKSLGKQVEINEQYESEIIKPTLKRYIILILFCALLAINSYQWIQVPSATTKAVILYGVESYVINLSSILMMMAFVFLSWPACIVIERIGIKRAVLMGSFGTMIGASIKCFSCHEKGVWLLLLGTTIVALSEQLVFSISTRLASVWFPDSQVSLAMSICVVGGQVGVAMGFLVPHWYLSRAETYHEISLGFYHMFISTTVSAATIFVLFIIFFDEEPKHAPGEARLKQRKLEQLMITESLDSKQNLKSRVSKFCRQIWALMKNKELLILSQSYGVVIGLSWAIQTLLDQIIDLAWPHDDILVGQAGFAIIVAGIITTPVLGRVMDSWRAYKMINVFISLGNIVSLIIFGLALHYKHSAMSIISACLIYGLFSVGYMVSALEYAVELTYPAPELVTSSFMNIMPQIYGVLFTLLGSTLVNNFGNEAASIFNVGLVILGLILVCSTREQLKRQDAVDQSRSDKDKKKLQQPTIIIERHNQQLV